MKRLIRKSLNLAEVIGIFTMIGVLCGAFIPHILRVREANRTSKLRFNLQKLRKRVEIYKTQSGRPPEDLSAAVKPDSGVPENPFASTPDFSKKVREIESDPPIPQDVSSSGAGGWLYNPNTGGVWADHPQFVGE